jgi:surfactin synthase thioesterase subunit
LAGLHGRYGSPASNALAHPEVRALALPALRADVGLLEAYRKSEGPLLECPIVALGGEEDASVRPRDLDGWRSETRGAFRVRLFAGDHFFLEAARSELLAEIARALLPGETVS